jgi:hypothetical protein
MATALHFTTRDLMVQEPDLNGLIHHPMFGILLFGSFTCSWTVCPSTHPRGLAKSLLGHFVENNDIIYRAKGTTFEEEKFNIIMAITLGIAERVRCLKDPGA